MATTRDENVSPAAAQLFEAFNRLSDGYSLDEVLVASTNFFACVIHNTARFQKMGDFDKYVEMMLAQASSIAHDNWKREPSAADIPVKTN